MSTFERQGHWRTSKFDNLHYVSGSIVTRGDRNKISGSERSRIRSALTRARASRSATARFLTPNARCPVCGQQVFFYQNQFGSRVFFDEVGPPWPKHPCTDNPTSRSAHKDASSATSPTLRATHRVAIIREWDARVGNNPDADFSSRHGSQRWPAYTVESRVKAMHGEWLLASRVDGTNGPRLFLHRDRWPAQLYPGELVFVRGALLAYLDRKLKAVELEVRRASGVRAFINELTSGEKGVEQM